MAQRNTPNMDAPCLSRLGLMRDPFPDAIDDALFFADAPRTQHLDLLHHLTQHSELLLLVTGERGAGKTSLLRQFVAQANESWRICVVDANPMMYRDQLLRQIYKGFGLAERSGGGHDLALTLLQEQLGRWQRGAEVAVLIVDDAHELPLPAFELLMRLAEASTNGNKLVRLVLFCEPQIESLLAAPQIQPYRHRVTHTLTLAGFSLEDTANFIRHRLGAAGLSDDSPLYQNNPFSPAALTRIAKLSQGLPAQVSRLATEALIVACGSEMGRPSAASGAARPRRKAGWTLPVYAVIAALALGAVLVLQDKLRSQRADQGDKDGHPPQQLQPKAVTKQHGQIRRLMPEPATRPPSELAATYPAGMEDADEPQAQVATDTIAPTAPASGDPEPEPAAKAAQPSSDSAPEPGTGDPDAKQGPTRPRPQPPVEAEAPREPPASPTPREESEKPPAPADGAAWLLAADPRHYTVQLLGASRAAFVHQFIAAHELEGRAVLIKTRRKGKDWFVLLYGTYPTKQEARAALANLPDTLKEASPWLRSIASLRPATVEHRTP